MYQKCNPSKFEFQFVGEDGNKYIYGFSATMWNAQSTKPPFEWFAKSIDTYTDLMQYSLDEYPVRKNENIGQFGNPG